MSTPKIFIVAGPNGAGKSTGAAAILPKRFPTERFLNADDIARALATDSPIEAGRVMIRRMHELRVRRETFAFETTLAGKTHVKFVKEARESGYLIHMAYVWLSSIELARRRISVRVQRGGHDIPRADVERRYWCGLENFFQLYLPLANRWALCDNSGCTWQKLHPIGIRLPWTEDLADSNARGGAVSSVAGGRRSRTPVFVRPGQECGAAWIVEATPCTFKQPDDTDDANRQPSESRQLGRGGAVRLLARAASFDLRTSAYENVDSSRSTIE